MIKKIKFHSEIGVLLVNPHKDSALISIRDSESLCGCYDKKYEKICNARWFGNHFLSIVFDDVDKDHFNKDEKETDEDFKKIYNKIVFFDNDKAKQIIDFVINLPENVEELHINCHTGVCRSPAIAKFFSEQYGLEMVGGEAYNRYVYKTLREVC